MSPSGINDAGDAPKDAMKRIGKSAKRKDLADRKDGNARDFGARKFGGRK